MVQSCLTPNNDSDQFITRNSTSIKWEERARTRAESAQGMFPHGRQLADVLEALFIYLSALLDTGYCAKQDNETYVRRKGP